MITVHCLYERNKSTHNAHVYTQVMCTMMQ